MRILSKSGESDHRYIADICTENRIYEIQTGSLYPLLPKITYYLNETDYDVTVVHPIPMVRYKIWIDPETGEVESRKKSPKKGSAEDALPELFWLRELLSHPRFHVLLLFLEEEEYRYLDGWSRDKKRGSNRCERVPAALLGSVMLYGVSDYRGFLKPELPTEFTATEFGILYGFRGKNVYRALKTLLSVGLARIVGSRGRSVLYARADFETETDGVHDSSLMEEMEAEDLTE